MKPKIFLFYPFEIGLAHIGRSLSVAEELQSRGHRIIFAIPRRKHHVFANSSIRFIDREEYYSSDQEIDIKYATSYEKMRSSVLDELEIINKYAPNAIIVDHFIPPLIAGKIANIRLFGIFNGQALPYNVFHPKLVPSRRLINTFINFLISILWRIIVRTYIKPGLSLFRQFSISISFEQWRNSIVFINPEPSFYFPLLPRKANVEYVGPLFWNNYEMNNPDWLQTIQKNGKTIYISFGGTGFHIKKFRKIVELLLSKNYRIIITTGTLIDSLNFPKDPNLFITQFIRSKEIFSKVDVTLCHGGYGTMIDSIKSGVPVVALPNNIDQIFHSMRMQELGLAKTIFVFRFCNLIKSFFLNTKWIDKQCETIKPEIIIDAVEEVFHNLKKYKINIASFNQTYPSVDGAVEAADIIEKGS